MTDKKLATIITSTFVFGTFIGGGAAVTIMMIIPHRPHPIALQAPHGDRLIRAHKPIYSVDPKDKEFFIDRYQEQRREIDERFREPMR